VARNERAGSLLTFSDGSTELVFTGRRPHGCRLVSRGASGSVTTIRRAELTDEETSMTAANDLAVRRALEAAGYQ
jgi:hypothetical protein